MKLDHGTAGLQARSEERATPVALKLMKRCATGVARSFEHERAWRPAVR